MQSVGEVRATTCGKRVPVAVSLTESWSGCVSLDVVISVLEGSAAGVC